MNVITIPVQKRSARPLRRRSLALGAATAALCMGFHGHAALADETCQSPPMPRITGEEEFVYVWTLGMEGVADGSDKVVTVDVRKDSPTFGKVIDVDSVGRRGEAHHGGFTMIAATSYDQSVFPKPESEAARNFYHILRVFLVDSEGRIHNIYSLDFLDPELVLNDIGTLILDRERDDRSSSQAK